MIDCCGGRRYVPGDEENARANSLGSPSHPLAPSPLRTLSAQRSTWGYGLISRSLLWRRRRSIAALAARRRSARTSGEAARTSGEAARPAGAAHRVRLDELVHDRLLRFGEERHDGLVRRLPRRLHDRLNLAEVAVLHGGLHLGARLLLCLG